MEKIVNWPRKLRILVVPPNNGGCAFYRSINPMQKLLALYGDYVDIRWDLNPLGFDEKVKSLPSDDDWPYENMKWADVILVNNISDYGGPYTVRVIGKAKEFGKFVHFDTDDLITDLYPEHRLFDVFTKTGLSEMTKFMYYHSDLITVTQKKFLERIKPFCKGIIAVIKNSIDYNLPCWNLPKVNHGKRTHIGWAAGIHHRPDVLEFASIPHLVNQKVGREKVFWDFYGAPNIDKNKTPEEKWQIDTWKEYKRALLSGFKGHPNWAVHHALPPDRYGQFYSNMDIAIAPLKMNNFNDSKCHKKGQLILMSDGTLSAVEDIKVGDKLMGPDSTERTVLNTTSGKECLYEVRPKRGKPFTVTGDHILVLKANDKNLLKRKPQFIQISVKNYLQMSKSDRINYRLYKVGVDFNPNLNLPLDPYFVGIMLGDGSFRKTVSLTSMDKELIDYFTNYCKLIDPSLCISEDRKKNNKAATYTAAQRFWRRKENKIMNLIRLIGLGGLKCEDKYIPHQYKTSSREDRLQILAGLLDTDGCLNSSKTFFTFSNKSKRLVDDLAFVARSLGLYVSPTKEFFVPSICDTPYYRVQISGDVDMIPTKLNRKKANKRLANRDPLTSSFKVVKLDVEDEYYGFKVDKDSLYLLDDFTVSHNSEIKVAECGRYKIPLICSDVGCYNETIVNGETGILIPAGANKTYWANKISELVKKPSEIKRMGENLHKITEQYFDLNKVVHLRLTLYDKVFQLKNYNPFEEKHND